VKQTANCFGSKRIWTINP